MNIEEHLNQTETRVFKVASQKLLSNVFGGAIMETIVEIASSYTSSFHRAPASKEVRLLKRFKSKTGKSFDAKLKLNAELDF